MTNREWLFSMTDRELAEFIADSEEFKTIKNSYLDSVSGITQWLGEEKGSMDYLFQCFLPDGTIKDMRPNKQTSERYPYGKETVD